MHFVYGFCDGILASISTSEANVRYVFATICGSVGQTGAFLPPAHVALGRRDEQNTELFDTALRLALVGSDVKQVSLRMLFGVECHEEHLYSFHVQPVQGLLPGASNLCHQLCRWFLHKNVDKLGLIR